MFPLLALAVLIHANLCSSFKMSNFQRSYISRNTVKMSAANQADYALLFDCDGVIVETEVIGLNWFCYASKLDDR